MIEIVSATRLAEAEFWEKSALGISLRRLGHDARLVPRIAFENKRGLPQVFNARIAATDGDSHDSLVFMHDDVWIDDYYVADRVIDGLGAFDVIGVAGNRRRVKGQPSWAFLDDKLTWDARDNLSGSIGVGAHPFNTISATGPVPAECELLDGVFLAASKASLQAVRVQFDPQFDFHFYDLDFCRNARKSGLRLGTWPICLTHQSAGMLGGDSWNGNYKKYLEKWGG